MTRKARILLPGRTTGGTPRAYSRNRLHDLTEEKRSGGLACPGLNMSFSCWFYARDSRDLASGLQGTVS